MLAEAERGRGGRVLVIGRVGSRSKKDGFGEIGGRVLRLKDEAWSAGVEAVGPRGLGKDGSWETEEEEEEQRAERPWDP